ncbi:MAG: glycosyltransferase [Planctomycetes bacterium]|nr:glycosyltransferase [Planctomycetota bacterium]
MTKITFCAIVRDEEALLGGCLESVKGVVDRMLVVDTGSTDRTREIAREHGAEVVEFAWCDDFAAARNAVLAHVTDGWLLVLDADERLASGGGRVLRKLAKRGGFDCGMLPLHNASELDASPQDVLSGAKRRGEAVLLPRFLRRTPDLAWEGIVHENLNAWVARGKRKMATVDAPIVHYGQVPDLRAAREKDARNLRLLERRVELTPDDPVARTYLAREYERNGNAAAAIAETERAWTDLLAARANGLNLDVVALATLRAFLLIRAGRLDEARAVLDHADPTAPDHPNLNLLRGVLEERVALGACSEDELVAALRTAERALQACLAKRGAAYWCELLPGATDWSAATRLGTVHLMQGRPRDAERRFAQALAAKPDHLEARLGVLEAEILRDGSEPALRVLEPLLHGDAPDAWALSALACLRLGHANDALSLALEARRRSTEQPPLAAHRQKLVEELITVLGESTPAALPSCESRVVESEEA